jgi:hypothetical protein
MLTPLRMTVISIAEDGIAHGDGCRRFFPYPSTNSIRLQAFNFEAMETMHSPTPSLNLIQRAVCHLVSRDRVLHVNHILGVIFSKITHLINLWGEYSQLPAIFLQ